MARTLPPRWLSIAGTLALVAATAGCYTTLRNPNAPATGGYGTEVVDVDGVYAYPHVPSATVLSWYSHYGPYEHYYAQPWWAHGHYYTGSHGDSPAAGTRVEGFDRGGRGGQAVPPSSTGVTSTGAPDGQAGTSASTPRAETQSPKPKKKEKVNVGGRGGRK